MSVFTPVVSPQQVVPTHQAGRQTDRQTDSNSSNTEQAAEQLEFCHKPFVFISRDTICDSEEASQVGQAREQVSCSGRHGCTRGPARQPQRHPFRTACAQDVCPRPPSTRSWPSSEKGGRRGALGVRLIPRLTGVRGAVRTTAASTQGRAEAFPREVSQTT